MATVISKEELDAHAHDMLDRAWAGEEIVIEERGAPKLRLVPIEGQPRLPRRQPGFLKGLVSVPPSFWEPLPPGFDGWPEDDGR